VTWRTSHRGGGGGRFLVDGQLVSEKNRQVALGAFNGARWRSGKQDHGEQYLLTTAKGQIPVTEFGDGSGYSGGRGYYQQGPDMGVRVCLDGLSDEAERRGE